MKDFVSSKSSNELSVLAPSVFMVMPLFTIGSTLATCDVEITSDGGETITERSICRGTAPNATTSNTKVQHGNAGTGKFRIKFSGLTERTIYHLRAYAVSASGLIYSNDVTFKTIGKGHIT